MDPLPNTDPLPVTVPPPRYEGFAGWVRQNAFNLLLGLVVMFVIIRYLNPLDVVLAAAGLTAIIFLHELGHFLAAKACNVRVETFSIGFGPALPYCSYKYGETTYKLAVVPLGGYVKMLGEGDGAGDEDADEDPRSFKNQSVGERMVIISAGVVMNILLGCGLFVWVYTHGLEEKPAVIARMEPGGAAWRAGLHSGSEIKKIGTREDPWFDDIRPIIWATQKGEQLPLVIAYKGQTRALTAEPLQDEGSPFPVLGILPPDRPVLAGGKRADSPPPYRVDSPAAAALSPNRETFQPGDRIVAMTDPDNSNTVTPLTPRPDDPPGEVFVFNKRLMKLAGQPVTVHVLRKDQPADAAPTPITVPPAYRKTTGLRVRMGEVVATRKDSPPETAKTPVQVGDQITQVKVTGPDGRELVWSADPKAAVPLDPLRLPHDLNAWANSNPVRKTVELTVLRNVEHTRKPVTLDLDWDEVGQFDLTSVGSPNSPVAVNGLGLAYSALAVVDGVAPGTSAAAAELQPNDRITAVRIKAKDHTGKVVTGSWEDLKPAQWAFVDHVLQHQAPFEVEVRVDRGGQTREVTLTATDDPTCPTGDDRGIDLADETRIMRAEGAVEALAMGGRRTLRSIQSIYMNLYAMAFGRVSFYKTVSGPITLARASYIIAGEDFWKLLLLLALISINLAVVNFLPIPVLDGGHMMFLTYEWIRGKPAPEAVQTILTFVGLGVILLLMVTVIGLDIWRLIRLLF